MEREILFRGKRDVIVIENIHDNPELLKGESKCANISE